MKLHIAFRHSLLIVLLFGSISTFGQTPIDSVVSIKFPGKVDTFKTAYLTASAKGLYINTEKESYILIRTTLLKNGHEQTILPADIAELNSISIATILPTRLNL